MPAKKTHPPPLIWEKMVFQFSKSCLVLVYFVAVAWIQSACVSIFTAAPNVAWECFLTLTSLFVAVAVLSTLVFMERERDVVGVSRLLMEAVEQRGSAQSS